MRVVPIRRAGSVDDAFAKSSNTVHLLPKAPFPHYMRLRRRAVARPTSLPQEGRSSHAHDIEGYKVKRRQLFTAAAAGGIGAVLVGNAAFADSASLASPALVAATADSAVEPVYGAGLFDVDPVQGTLSQSPNSVVTGNISAMPADWSF